MTREEWDSIGQVVRDRWIGIDETDTEEWWHQLSDLDGGLVAQALIDLADAGETPTATTIRRAVNAGVRAAAEANPLPPPRGEWITFAEWLRRGAPTYRPDERNREAVIEGILASPFTSELG